jgi:SAM-dependent methyltransferase
VIWRCPKCRGFLVERGQEACCESCSSCYEKIDGILDLRLTGASWIDYEVDKATARRLVAESAGLSAEELVRRVFSARPEWDETRIALRTRQVVTAPERLRAELGGWLRPRTLGAGLFLDLGCGPGMFLAAAAAEGRRGIGIDVSLVWLIVAKRLITQWGGQPMLAAALAEALPLADAAVSSVVSLDVIEHVADPRRYLQEINRVTEFGGSVMLSTPNRYSLAAEPHTSIWGVGWLPRSWQKRYVRWWSGESYEYTRLLSAREVARLFVQYTCFHPYFFVPSVPEGAIADFPAYRAILARLYNRLVSLGWTRWLFLKVGPFFQVVGKKA